MARQKHTPNLEGLSETFEVVVDYDDPRWQDIDPEQYRYCNKLARVWDFPLHHKSGKHTVKCAWISKHPWAIRLAIADIQRRHLWCPDRAVTETVLAQCVDEIAGHPAFGVGICGAVGTDEWGSQIIFGICGNTGHLSVYLCYTGTEWPRYAVEGGFQPCRFLVVVPEE